MKLEYSCAADPVLKKWTCDTSIPANEVDPWTDKLLCAGDREQLMEQWRTDTPPVLGLTRGLLGNTCRHIATAFQANPDCDAVVMGQIPPGLDTWQLKHEYGANGPVLWVTLAALPEPREETPWEDIFSFREDAAARAALARLRNWMDSVAKDCASPAAVEDELIALLADYEGHMKLHHIKTERGILEAVLTTAAEVAQAVVTMKWGTAVKALFDVSRAEISLMEAEKNAPGREVAYLACARARFG